MAFTRKYGEIAGILSDSDLRQPLLSTCRLVSLQVEVDGAILKHVWRQPSGPPPIWRPMPLGERARLFWLVLWHSPPMNHGRWAAAFLLQQIHHHRPAVRTAAPAPESAAQFLELCRRAFLDG